MITVISTRSRGAEGTDDRAGRGVDFRLYPQKQRRHAVGGRQEIKAVVHAHATEPRGVAAADGGRLPPGSLGLLIAVDFAPERLEATREALAAAIDALPDGVRFALLEDRTGADGSPREPEWETADLWQRRRAQATAQWMHLNARLTGLGGREGPVCTDWLSQARALFSQDAPGMRLRHLLIVTDGRSPRTPGLDDELAACEGVFTCGMLGVGDGWRPDVLAEITQRLHGEVEYVRNGEEAAAMLTRTVDRLLRTRLPVAPLEVTLRAGVELGHIREVSPRPRPLTAAEQETEQETDREAGREGDREGERTSQGPGRHVFATRLWRAGESRTYEVTLAASPSGDPLEEDLQLAAVALGSAHAPLLVRWSAVRGSAAGAGAPPRAGDPVSAIGQRTKLVHEFTEGCKALGRGDVRAAEAHLSAATRLAHALGDSTFMNEVQALADVLDAARGQVRVRPKVDRLSLAQAELRGHTSALVKQEDEDADGPSSWSAAVGRADEVPHDGAGPGEAAGTTVFTCRCGTKSRIPQSSYCIRCGEPL